MPDHRRPSSVLAPTTDILLELRAVAGRVGLDAAVRKGRDIVVTNIDCLSRALSETSAERKLKMQSNGRWEESTGGNFRALFNDVVDDEADSKRRLGGGVDLPGLSRSVEDPGELFALPGEANRNTFGGDNEPSPPASSSASDNSSIPSPPVLRQIRATRSAHSSTLTNLIAPASSIARGVDKRRIRTAGNVLDG